MTLYATKIGRNVNRTKKATALAVTQEVVFATPVDTGKARSNWIASLGEEVDTVIAPHAPGSHLGVSESANGSAAVALAASIINVAQEGQDIVIQNNVDYIGKLNEGTSKQAPAAFVQRAATVGVEVVQNSKVVDGN